MEEGATLEQGAAVGQQCRGLLDGRVVRAVAVHGEGDLPGVTELGEVVGETRLVPLDGVAVGGDRRHPLPVLTEGRSRQQPAAHRDPVGLDVSGQLSPGEEGVGTHGRVLGHAPEGDVAPALGAGEDLLPGAQRRVAGVVGQDELVEVGEPVPAQVLQTGPVGTGVEPLIGALENLVAAGLQPGAVGVTDGRVGDQQDVVGMGAQGAERGDDIVTDLMMRIEVEVDESSVHVEVLPGRWSTKAAGNEAARRPVSHALLAAPPFVRLRDVSG